MTIITQVHGALLTHLESAGRAFFTPLAIRRPLKSTNSAKDIQRPPQPRKLRCNQAFKLFRNETSSGGAAEDTQGSRSTDVADPFTPPKADKLRKSFRINAQSARDSRTAGLSATPKIHRVNRKFKVSAARLMISETPSLKGSWSEIPKHLMIDKKPIKYDVSKQFGKISRKAPWVWDPEKGIDLHILMNKVTKDQDQQYVTVWNKSSTHSVIYTLHDKQSDLYLWEKKLDPNGKHIVPLLPTEGIVIFSVQAGDRVVK
ncbi:hypothetical protein KEM48_014516 [Puccinia striiformis f. sp. tritici PST-130]|nr:hypothetical protein KEM48_014516 [Puccinia striiformis f. sp. tritici PST-130]